MHRRRRGAASTEPKAVQATAKPETTAETEQKTAKATSKPDKSVSKTESTDEEFKKKKTRSRKISINQRRNLRSMPESGLIV